MALWCKVLIHFLHFFNHPNPLKTTIMLGCNYHQSVIEHHKSMISVLPLWDTTTNITSIILWKNYQHSMKELPTFCDRSAIILWNNYQHSVIEIPNHSMRKSNEWMNIYRNIFGLWHRNSYNYNDYYHLNT
jgi:hypothetical protein